jgi:hypothetical protein
MNRRIEIRCPNCGSLAQRLLSDCLPTGRKCPYRQVTQTECPVCDYFMVMCGQNGRVLEAYAPGIQEVVIRNRLGSERCQPRSTTSAKAISRSDISADRFTHRAMLVNL